MRYIYFGRFKGMADHKGITCVGYEFEDNKKMKMSFAFCSPEERFSRKKAHTILNGRMQNDQVVTANTQEKPMKYEEVTAMVRDFINAIAPNDIKAYSNNHKYKKHASVGGVNFPWWFTEV